MKDWVKNIVKFRYDERGVFTMEEDPTSAPYNGSTIDGITFGGSFIWYPSGGVIGQTGDVLTFTQTITMGDETLPPIPSEETTYDGFED